MGTALLIAALLAAALWRLGLLRYRFEARRLAKTPKVPWRVV